MLFGLVEGLKLPSPDVVQTRLGETVTEPDTFANGLFAQIVSFNPASIVGASVIVMITMSETVLQSPWAAVDRVIVAFPAVLSTIEGL